MSVILVVDDEEPIRSLLRDTLELDGYEVCEASDGPSALMALDLWPPDGLILDVMMPGMSGIEVLREIRIRQGNFDMPVILLTAAADDETTWDGWKAGASCFLTKPFDPESLLVWIDRLVTTCCPRPQLPHVPGQRLGSGAAQTPPLSPPPTRPSPREQPTGGR